MIELLKISKRLRNTTLKRKIMFLMSSLIVLAPTLLVSFIAITYYHIGIETMFSEKITNTIDDTVHVAEAYLEEHKQNIKADTLAIANDIYKNLEVLSEEGELIIPFINKQAELRGLSDITIIRNGGIVAQTNFSYSLIFEKLPYKELEIADRTKEVVIISDDNNDKVRAILRLDKLYDGYLLVGRPIDTEITEHIRKAQGSYSQYNIILQEFKDAQSKIQITFVLLSMALTIITIIVGARLARVIVMPVNRLVEATERIREGDFNVKVPEKDGRDEIAILGRAFNQMTTILSNQREELISINSITEERRRFIETVLSEISAGVIAINLEGKITLHNTAAVKFLNIASDVSDNSDNIIGTHYSHIFPEANALLDKATIAFDTIIQEYISIIRGNNKFHILVNARAQIGANKKIESYVMTFDDITDLVSAQRSAAWAEVAKRVAHEIKNPLTPIQLSAERIRKKYLSYIKDDKENFDKYTNTIIKHVSDIESIVQEFINLGNIAPPKLSKTNITNLIKEIIFSQRCTYKAINYNFNESSNIYVLCDAMKISQVLFNLMKNSAESIIMKNKYHDDFIGKIDIQIIEVENNFIEIRIIDNGLGFKLELIDRAFEPYISNKNEGMGLGLAIVQKIIEDHTGKIIAENNKNKDGATISFTLKKYIAAHT